MVRTVEVTGNLLRTGNRTEMTITEESGSYVLSGVWYEPCRLGDPRIPWQDGAHRVEVPSYRARKDDVDGVYDGPDPFKLAHTIIGHWLFDDTDWYDPCEDIAASLDETICRQHQDSVDNHGGSILEYIFEGAEDCDCWDLVATHKARTAEH